MAPSRSTPQWHQITSAMRRNAPPELERRFQESCVEALQLLCRDDLSEDQKRHITERCRAMSEEYALAVYVPSDKRKRAQMERYRRINRVLARLSRERWLSTAEVQRIAIKMASKAGSWSPLATAKAAVSQPAMFHSGMLRGQPLLGFGDPAHHVLIPKLDALSQKQRAKGAAEVLILEHYAKANRNGRKSAHDVR